MRLWAGMTIAVAAVGCWFGMAGTAAASVCADARAADGATAQICITSPASGTTVSGGVTVTGTAVWHKVRPSDVAGCAGQRLTPSGCITWTVNGVYQLTHLYKTPGTSSYRWVWHSQAWTNGPKTLTASIALNNAPHSASIHLNVANPPGTHLGSPNTGLLPIFSQATPFVIAATGDGAAGSTYANAVAAMVEGWHPNMFMYLGDVYQRGSKDEFMDFYDPTFGPLRKITVPTVGNHEYKIYSTAAPYFWYWNYPDSKPTRPGGGGQYYSFNAGGWHIISLDANIAMDPMSPQGVWLHNDLATHPNSLYPCTLAFWHQERFSDISLRLPSTSALWVQLFNANADLIVNAHAHAYERWRPLNAAGQVDLTRGITQLVAGTGGNVLSQNWQTNDSRSAFRDHSNWGAIKLALYPGHATYQFIASGSKDGTANGLKDQGTVNCH